MDMGNLQLLDKRPYWLNPPKEILVWLQAQGITLNLATLYRWAEHCPMLKKGKVDSEKSDRTGNVMCLDRREVLRAAEQIRPMPPAGQVDRFDDKSGAKWIWLDDAAKYLTKKGFRFSPRVMRDYCEDGWPALKGKRLHTLTRFVRAEHGIVYPRIYLRLKHLKLIVTSLTEMKALRDAPIESKKWLTFGEAQSEFPYFGRECIETYSRGRHPFVAREKAIATKPEHRLDDQDRACKYVVYSREHLEELTQLEQGKTTDGAPLAFSKTGRISEEEAVAQGYDRKWLRTEVRAGRLAYELERCPRIGRGKKDCRMFLPAELKAAKEKSDSFRHVRYRDEHNRIRWRKEPVSAPAATNGQPIAPTGRNQTKQPPAKERVLKAIQLLAEDPGRSQKKIAADAKINCGYLGRDPLWKQAVKMYRGDKSNLRRGYRDRGTGQLHATVPADPLPDD